MTDTDKLAARYPKQPSSPEHRDLALRHLAALKERDALLAERDDLKRQVADYASNLGDIVTYGTTADVLDQHLGRAIAERDALKAENERLRTRCERMEGLIRRTMNAGARNRWELVHDEVRTFLAELDAAKGKP